MFSLNLFRQSNILKFTNFFVFYETNLKCYIWKFKPQKNSGDWKLFFLNFLILRLSKLHFFYNKIDFRSKSIFEGFFLKKNKYIYKIKKCLTVQKKIKKLHVKCLISVLPIKILKNIKIGNFLNFFISIYSSKRKIFFLFNLFGNNIKKKRRNPVLTFLEISRFENLYKKTNNNSAKKLTFSSSSFQITS
jgi:hypothetical protein